MNQPKEESPKKVLQQIVASKLAILGEESSRGQHQRAILRQSLGDAIEESPKVWNILYTNLPVETLQRRDFKRLERAIFSTLQLYAVHAKKVDEPNSFNKDATIGRTLYNISQNSSSPENFTKKMTGLFSEDNYDAITRRLLSYIRQGGLPLNYSELAWHLYLIQTNKRKDVLYRWGTDFYRTNAKNSETNVKTTTKEAK